MNIVFFGTPEFGATILEKLVEADKKPCLVVTVPDRPAGRKQLLTSPPVKTMAERYGIPILQTEDRSMLKEKLSAIKPDLVVLASYGVILPKEVLDLPKHGALNVHPSLLPQYRGPSPVPSAILAGKETTGVSIMLMDEQLDHGPIVVQKEFPIGDVTSLELKERLAELGGELLVETIPQWIAGTITQKEQDHSQATFTKRFLKKDGRIDWNQHALYIARQIRAFDPWPGTHTSWQGKMLKILKGSAVEISSEHSPLPPGTTIPWQKGFAVVTPKGALVVERLQPEGGKPMPAKDFLLGHKDFLGSILD